MKYILVAIMALAVATSVPAQAESPFNMRDDFYPPSHYDHEYAGKLFISAENDLPVLERACGLKTMGCSQAPGTHGLALDECLILLPKREDLAKTGVSMEDLKRHEIAHCNGWRHGKIEPGPRPPPMEVRNPPMVKRPYIQQ
jgi:hypothetical protein